MPIKIVYFGTSPFAVPPLLALLDRPGDFEVVAVVTKPDQPIGRDQRLTPSAVAKAAHVRGLKVLTPAKMRDEAFQAELGALGADVFVVAAYGKILPAAILALPPRGCVNLHGSLLPKHRGASPIQAALAAGESETGVTLMGMDEEMDHGATYSRVVVAITDDDTFATLEAKLSAAAADLLVRDLPAVVDGALPPVPQNHAAATYTGIIGKEAGLVDFAAATAKEISDRRRAFDPWPGLHVIWTRKNQPLRLVLKAVTPLAEAAPTGLAAGTVFRAADGFPAVACANGTALRLELLQPEGKKPTDGKALLNGYGDFVGTKL